MRKLYSTLMFVAAAGVAAAEPYDYFRNAVYPVKLRPDVSLDRIEQEGGPDVVGYKRRTVHWWPKKGVDRVDVPEGTIFRTWTLLPDYTEDDSQYYSGALRWPADQPRTFNAHLLGFRGIGNRYWDAFGNRRIKPTDNWAEMFEANLGPHAPAVVLRLEDGRKRLFGANELSAEDKQFVLTLYLKEMERIRKTLYNGYYNVDPKRAEEFPQSAEVGDPGTFRVESDRFVFTSGSQGFSGRRAKWINNDDPSRSEFFRKGAVAQAEDFWAYQEYAGGLMPYWDRDVLYKYHIAVGGTLKNGDEYLPGGAGGGYGGSIGGGAPWTGGLWHEWGHGTIQGGGAGGGAGLHYPGGGESSSCGFMTMADPDNHAWANHPIENPHKHLFHGYYAGALGYVMIPDDPNWGYAMVMTVLNQAAPAEKTLPHVLARLGQERGMWKNGIKGVGDLIGQTYARMAEFDCESEWILRKQYRAARRYRLEPVDVKKRIYRMPMQTAPEPFGGNIIRLVPDKGAQELVVDFRGIYDPDTYADWRACIVAVGSDGLCRYSPLWNKGVMSMPIKDSDRRFWLTVAGTPQALADFAGINNAQPMDIYERDFLYAYPYEVTLKGCHPGSPHLRIGDIENAQMIFGANHGLPHPPDDRDFDRVKHTLDALIARYDAATPGLAVWMADYAQKEEWFRAEHRQQGHRVHIAKESNRARAILEDAEGQRHANGGGWVAASAEVAATAYVGPDCMVLDGARVHDHAILECGAVATGEGTVVAEHARITGALVIGRKTKTYARVQRNNGTERFEARLMMEGKSAGRIDTPMEADFAMDRPETVLLEDWFKSSGPGGAYPSGLARMHRIYHSGILYGEPGFVVDGGRRGFTFNGRDQYAETGSAAGDFHELTIDLAVRWDGKPGEAIFDFGTGPEKSMVLLAAGDSGKPELIVTCGEESFTLQAGAALRQGQWQRLRVEIDGKRTRLIVDSAGGLANSKDTSFRPAHLYPGGRARRNFIAARRDRSSFFTGAIDYVRIYHTVLEAFGEGPALPVTSGSRRIAAELVQGILDFYDIDAAGEALRAAAMESSRDEGLVEEEDVADWEKIPGPDANDVSSAGDHLALVSSAKRANTEGIQAALDVQQAEWFTTVSWDDRLCWEVSGDISPHLRRWLARMKPDKYKQPVLDPKLFKPDPEISAKVTAFDKAGWELMKSRFMKPGHDLPEAASWAYVPVAVSETSLKMAGVKLHPSVAVEYRFEATDGGHSSGWQESCVYEDKGLDKNRSYTYRVHMREKGGKAIQPSEPHEGKTDLGSSYIMWSDMGLPYMGTWSAFHHGSFASATHAWVAEAPGKAGDVMASLPADTRTAEKLVDAPFMMPRLDYIFRFDEPGAYWIWIAGFVYGHGEACDANTICIGLDLEPLKQIHTVDKRYHKKEMWWPWITTKIEIEEAGFRRVSIWAREGGTRFGRIVISNKDGKSFRPSNQLHRIGAFSHLIGEGYPDSRRVEDGVSGVSLHSADVFEDDSIGLDNLDDMLD